MQIFFKKDKFFILDKDRFTCNLPPTKLVPAKAGIHPHFYESNSRTSQPRTKPLAR